MKFYSTPDGNFLHSFRGDLISYARLASRDCILYIKPEASDLNREFSYFPQLLLLELGCNGLKNFSKRLKDVKEGGISARKAGQMWGLSIKKSTLQARRNRPCHGFRRHLDE